MRTTNPTPMATMTYSDTGFGFESEFVPMDDFFAQPLPGDEHSNWFPPTCGSMARKLSLGCDTPCSRRGASATAKEVKDFVSGALVPLPEPCPTDDSWTQDAMLNSHIDSSETFNNYFWNQKSSDIQPSNVPMADFESADWKNTQASSSRSVQAPAHQEPLSIDVQHTMWAGEKKKPAKKAPKERCRTNKKALYWTPEDHQKFVAGLEKFGLNDGLGPGGAELMSVYMGNRSVLQIKSHFQKHLSDLANGKKPRVCRA